MVTDGFNDILSLYIYSFHHKSSILGWTVHNCMRLMLLAGFFKSSQTLGFLSSSQIVQIMVKPELRAFVVEWASSLQLYPPFILGVCIYKVNGAFLWGYNVLLWCSGGTVKWSGQVVLNFIYSFIYFIHPNSLW